MKLDNLNGKCNDPSDDWAMTVQWPNNDPGNDLRNDSNEKNRRCDKKTW